MKSTAFERRFIMCLFVLLAAAFPLLFTACGTGVVAPTSDTSQPSNSPTVVSVVPDTGSPSGGMAVTINGSNFTSDTQQTAPSVSFGGIQATQVSVLSSAQLSAVVPAHAAGTVAVKVTTANGASSSLARAFTYSASSLTVKSVSPISGPSAGGTTVTISGDSFQSGVSVTFGGLAATSVTLSSSSSIVAVTPEHSSGSTTITVTNSNGQSATLSSGFTFHSVSLLWSAPASSSVVIAGYNVYRSQTSAGPFAKLNGASPVPGTSFSDPTVQGNSTYYYEVTSVASTGAESSPDGPVATTTSP